MAGASVLDDVIKSLRRNKKFQTAGRIVSTAQDGMSVGGLKQVSPQDIENFRMAGLGPTREVNKALAQPGYRPKTWAEVEGQKTYESIRSNEVSEYAQTARYNAENRNLGPATLKTEEGLSGIQNRMHRVIDDEEGAMSALVEVKNKLEAKAAFFEAQEARLRADRKAGKPLLRKDGRPASNQKGAYEEAIDRARRTANDYRTTAPEPVVAQWLDELAKPGYRAAVDQPGGKVSGQGPLKGRLDEIIEQHHGFPNQEAADMMKQTAMVNEVFKLNVWQYIAKQYRTGLGRSRSNMWNIPASVHRGEKVGLHAWLTQMGFDDYWKKLLAKNPNMTQQEIMNAIDMYFDDVFYPSLIQVENLVLSTPKKYKWKGMRLPNEVLKDGKERLNTLLRQVDEWQPTTFADREPGIRDFLLEKRIDDAHKGQAHAQHAFSPPQVGPATRDVMLDNEKLLIQNKGQSPFQ